MKPFYILIVMAIVIGGAFYWSKGRIIKYESKPAATQEEKYEPTIDANNFVSKVNNKYFTLKPGTKFTYTENINEGVERIEMLVTNKTKIVMGVTTTVVQDTAWLNNKLKEDTTDLYAQDKQGNVWYFGETVNNYDNGALKDHSGSWEAGTNNAMPGIIMPSNPKVGESYRQEYSKGIAEDMADNVAVNQKVTVPYGSFDNCLKTRDWSKIDSTLNEYKLYCPTIGFLVAGDSVNEPGQEKLELISISPR